MSFCSSLPQASLLYILQPSVTKPTRDQFVKFLSVIDRSHFVIDYSYDGSDPNAWSSVEVNAIRGDKKPTRKIISYLSIGEAEQYRYYWKKEWNQKEMKPSFIHTENPAWDKNFKVRYWHKEWQAIVLDYLDKIITAGFDGIYMDIIDAYEFYEYDAENDRWDSHRINPETQNTYREDMILFVQKIHDFAKKKNKNFSLIGQNGVTLLESKAYTNLIDGIGVEDLFSDGEEWHFDEDYIQHKANLLRDFKAHKKSVFLIEYCNDKKLEKKVSTAAKKLKFPLLITDRPLTQLGRIVR